MQECRRIGYENIRKDCSIKYFAPKGASLMGEKLKRSLSMDFVNEKLEEFNKFLDGKKVAIIGMGVSNVPC